MTKTNKPAFYSMSAHTPGPWTADKLQDQSAFNIFMQGYGSAGASVHHCSNATNCMGSLEVDANARLIAAAPDLLAALQLLVAEYEPNLKAFALNAPRKAKWDAARAAIAKVEGGAA